MNNNQRQSKQHRKTVLERITRKGLVVTIAAIGMALAGCQSSRYGSNALNVGAGSHHLDCGAQNIYVNNTSKEQRVEVTASNNCEFTAYLWIRFSSGHVIDRDLKRGDTFSETVRLPPDGSVEFWCSMVSTVENPGCDFTVTPL